MEWIALDYFETEVRAADFMMEFGDLREPPCGEPFCGETIVLLSRVGVCHRPDSFIMWVAQSPRRKKVLIQGPFYVEFTCSPCACVGFLLVLRSPPEIQRHAG